MKAAWDWHLPRESETARRELVEFVVGLGFDTLVIGRPEEDLVHRAHELGLQVIGVVSPSVDADLARAEPETLQRMLPYEERMLEAIVGTESERTQRLAHRWFPILQGGRLFCYEHPRARELLLARVSATLETADGVALDGFGFANHYACFCDACASRHGSDPAQLASASEASLVEISRLIFEHAKSVHSDAVVMNHVWPPFDPNPYYGRDLYLDYCTQTISWFYRPVWSLERVSLEAALHRSLERSDRNRFVPFIGLYADEYQTRDAQRIERELEIAREYGSGSFVFCTLEAPWKRPELRRVVQDATLG